MFFNSLSFAVFFTVLYGAYLLTMRRLKVQNALLLVGSYYFYGCWDWRFLGLIAFSTLVDYVCGQLLDRRRGGPRCNGEPETAGAYQFSAARRKAILAVSLFANLGILGLFKYYDFFTSSATDLLAAFGVSVQPQLLNVVLPVGISFYTFQTLSYTIDIYRGALRAHHSLLDFSVFVAFFPQLVAGPIVRAKDFLPQVARRRKLDLDQIYVGGYLVFWGLFKKVFIADNLARLVDSVFSQNSWSHGGVVVVGVYAFAVQIYCDFSGYTDIARGCGKMMGFELPINFNLPYFSSNPVEFWRRWHITLSTWLRDYLYIPLGGNRRGVVRMYVAIAITMLLGGLWHGAAWTYVIWGAYHGLLLVGYKAYKTYRSADSRATAWQTSVVWLWFRRIAFFQFTCLGWLIFRAESMEQVGNMMSTVAAGVAMHGSGVVTLCAYSLPLLLVQLAQFHRDDLNVILRWPTPARGLAYTAFFYAMMCFGALADQPFIYFQF